MSTFAAENRRQKMTSTFKDNANKVGFVTLKVNVGEHEYCFLVDTGSTQNGITNELYEENAPICKVISNVTVTGMDGATIEQILVGMPYQCSSISSMGRFFVMTSNVFKSVENEIGLKLDGILGIPFLFKHKVVIDYASKELHIASEETNEK